MRWLSPSHTVGKKPRDRILTIFSSHSLPLLSSSKNTSPIACSVTCINQGILCCKQQKFKWNHLKQNKGVTVYVFVRQFGGLKGKKKLTSLSHGSSRVDGLGQQGSSESGNHSGTQVLSGCFSKCSPWTSSITRECVGNAHSQVPPQTYQVTNSTGRVQRL